MSNDSPQVAAIRARYKASFNEKKSLIYGYLQSLKDDDVDVESVYLDLHSELHKLAGSSGMYGYDDISEICRLIMKEISGECFHEVISNLEKLNEMFSQYMKD